MQVPGQGQLSRLSSVNSEETIQTIIDKSKLLKTGTHPGWSPVAVKNKIGMYLHV